MNHFKDMIFLPIETSGEGEDRLDQVPFETIHYFLKRYVEHLNAPARDEMLERELAEYERRLRHELMADHALSELAAAQRSAPPPGRLLPMLGAPVADCHGSAGPGFAGT
jgi:hypothetical protein